MLNAPNPLFGAPQIEDPTKETGTPFAPKWNGGNTTKPSQWGTNFGVPAARSTMTYRTLPGMTREEIIRRQAESERLKTLGLEEEWSRIRAEADARQNMRRGLQSLHGIMGELNINFPQTLDPQALENANAFVPHVSAPADSTPDAGTAVSPLLNPKETDDTPLTKPTEPANPSALVVRDSVRLSPQDQETLKKREAAKLLRLKQRSEAERDANLFTITPAMTITPQRLRDGWCHLFDGQTLFGWQTQQKGTYGGGRFTVKNDDVPIGEIRSNSHVPGLLYTTSQFGDSTILFEYQAEEKAEAYLLLRTSPDPADLRSSCYAITLNSENASQPPGAVVGRKPLDPHALLPPELQRGGQKNVRNLPGSATWTRFQARFEGTRLQVTVNQNPPIIFVDPAPLGYGYIGLLVVKGDVRFRNVFWKPGACLSLIDAVHPEKFWRQPNDAQSDAVKLKPAMNGAMQLSGGPGVVESVGTYGNFVLQFEYNIAFNSGRSGLFFRSTPGLSQSGYEISLQNFPTRADRDAIAGVDAGSFRLIRNGRYVRPQDQTWNHITLLAVDRRFQTWINGIPVAERYDTRPASAPSESGPFLSPGTLQLLAPTAETNIDFRNIRIMPVAPRFNSGRTEQKKPS